MIVATGLGQLGLVADSSSRHGASKVLELRCASRGYDTPMTLWPRKSGSPPRRTIPLLTNPSSYRLQNGAQSAHAKARRTAAAQRIARLEEKEKCTYQATGAIQKKKPF